MRTIESLAAFPSTLRSTGPGGQANNDNIAKHTLRDGQPKRFRGHWNSEDVRGVLYANQWRVCAYCLRSLPGNDRGDVEHFRPKKAVTDDPEHGGYWWLAYELSNYLLSCRICNASRKRNRFPLQNPERRATYDIDPTALHELPFLFNPKVDDVDQWFSIDLSHRHVLVVPTNGLSPKQAKAAVESLSFFRINTDQFLIRERLHALDRTISAIEAGDTDRAKRLAVRYSPQSIVARQVMQEIFPESLPSLAFEVSWLLDRIVEEFDDLSNILEENPLDARSRIELKETMWTLAALFNSPPDNDAARIAALSSKLGIEKEITSLAEQLSQP